MLLSIFLLAVIITNAGAQQISELDVAKMFPYVRKAMKGSHGGFKGEQDIQYIAWFYNDIINIIRLDPKSVSDQELR
jgi:hypothetical protein